MSDLPIEPYLSEIISSIKTRSYTIIKAAPGAGKTTMIPASLMKEGKTIVLEPRRLAAKLSAQSVARMNHYQLGQEVGYQVRFDHKVSAKTQLRYVTEGLFLRLLQSQPNLEDFDYVVIDEFHERHIDTDLAYTLVRRLIESSRPELRLVIMSATLDQSKLEHSLPNPAVFDIPGRTYPVKIEYIDPPASAKLEAKLLSACRKMMSDTCCSGHILVFLTGYRQIKSCQDYLKRSMDSEQVDVLALAASLSIAEQDKVFAKSTKRKIILATNVAETSLTIQGVTGVIDFGLAKIASYAPWSGLPVLQVLPISQGACIQRSGRAGRTQEGVCYRLFSENDYLRRPAFPTVEIKQSDLSSLILTLKSNPKGPTIDELDWLDSPPEVNIDAAILLLRNLDFIDENQTVTSLGQAASQLPLHPRLAALVLHAKRLGVLEQGILLAALLSEGLFLKPTGKAFANDLCDLSFQAKSMLNWMSAGELETHQMDRAVDHGALVRIKTFYKQLASVMDADPIESLEFIDTKKSGEILLASYADRVAKYRPAAKNKKRPDQRSFHFCLGKGGVLSDSSVVKKHEYILVLDAVEAPGGHLSSIKTQIQLASAVSKDLLFSKQSMLKQQYDLELENDKLKAFTRTYYGDILLQEEVRPVMPEEAHEVLKDIITRNWPYPFENEDALKEYHKKLDLIEEAGVEHSLPRFEGDLLEILIDEIVGDKTSIDTIRKKTLAEYLWQQLSYEEQAFLDHLCPKQIKLGTKNLRITYLGDHSPYVSGYVQQFFGVQQAITIVDGRIPLSVVMLAPNRRPAQITKDLSSFWGGSYQELRKELARRYPKHDWPVKPE